MLVVSELTAMEMACWAIEDTVNQLRQRDIVGEAQALNRALHERTREAPVSAETLIRRTQARIAHLRDQFRTLQLGLVDYIDLLSTQIIPAAAHIDGTSNLSLQGYFGRAPRDAQDTQDRRARSLKAVLETLMNESLLGLPEPSELTQGDTAPAPENGQENDILAVLERIGIAEKKQGKWRLVNLNGF
ncbi:hypothetical protein JCM3766R1_004871 [Sporobolomyces carnicolor]